MITYSNINSVPFMTSNTAPSGVVSASASYSSDLPWKAFDGIVNGGNRPFWYATSTAPVGGHWIQYKFNTPKKISRITLESLSVSGSLYGIKNFSFYGSNDGVSYTKLYSDMHPNSSGKFTYSFFNLDDYIYYKLSINESYYSVNNVLVAEIEMFEYISGNTDFDNGLLKGKNVIYVSNAGSDSSGDGSRLMPYATLKKGIEMAKTGEGIFVYRGEYTLSKNVFNAFSTDIAEVAVMDFKKNLTIVGESQYTTLFFDSSNGTLRDNHFFALENQNSIVANFNIKFKVKTSPNDYSKAIARSLGSFYNLFIKRDVSGDTWTYSHASSASFYNCIFEGGVGGTINSPSSSDVYINCLYDTTPNLGNKKNSITRTVTEADWNPSFIIPSDLKNTGDTNILNKNRSISNIGVRGGQYEWEMPYSGSIDFINTIKIPYRDESNVNTSILIPPFGKMVGMVNISPIYNSDMSSNIQVKNTSNIASNLVIPPFNKMELVVDIYPPPVISIDNNPIQDAFVRSTIPRLNYGTEQEMVVGRSDSSEEFKSIVKFDLSNIPPSQKLITAEMKIFYDSNSSVIENINLNKALNAWTEQGVTWANFPTSSFVKSFNTVPDSGYISIDILDLVKEWYSEKSSNYGVVLETTSKMMHRFYTKERNKNIPILHLEYYDPNVKSIGRTEQVSSMTIVRHENIDQKSSLTVRSRYQDIDIPTTIHALNPDMIESFALINKPVMPSSLSVRRSNNTDINNVIQVRQRGLYDVDGNVKTIRTTVLGTGIIRVNQRKDLTSNITIKRYTSKDFSTVVGVSRPSVQTSINTFNSNAIDSVITIRGNKEKNIYTNIQIQQSSKKDITGTIWTLQRSTLRGDIFVASGYLKSGIVVPFKASKDVNTKLSVQTKYASDLMSSIGSIQYNNLLSQITVLEQGMSGGFVIII